MNTWKNVYWALKHTLGTGCSSINDINEQRKQKKNPFLHGTHILHAYKDKNKG